jgi:hypothetical protein
MIADIHFENVIPLLLSLFFAVIGLSYLLSGKARIISGKIIRKSDKPFLFWNRVFAAFVMSLLCLIAFIYELFR